MCWRRVYVVTGSITSPVRHRVNGFLGVKEPHEPERASEELGEGFGAPRSGGKHTEMVDLDNLGRFIARHDFGIVRTGVDRIYSLVP
jgi:hypothetical protein